MEWITLAWRYRNEIAIAVIVLILLLAGLYINSVFKEREQLEIKVAHLQEEFVRVQKQMTLNEDIANAIKKIRIQSNNYISTVENSPRPANDKPILFISAGLPTTFSVYSSNTNGSTYSSNATGDAITSK